MSQPHQEQRERFEIYLSSLGVAGPFLNKALLVRAFTHKSYAADGTDYGPLTHNERLEFLGDSILGAVIATVLYRDFPVQQESQLTLSKIYLVKEKTLADVARRIGLGGYVLLGNGEEKSGGRDKASVLSDTLEAIIAYIYLERGQEAVERFVKKHIYTMLDGLEVLPTKSWKSQLQELVQKHLKEIPHYTEHVLEQEASGNVLVYGSEVRVQGELYGTGTGSSKKKAQELAAKDAYTKLQNTF